MNFAQRTPCHSGSVRPRVSTLRARAETAGPPARRCGRGHRPRGPSPARARAGDHAGQPGRSGRSARYRAASRDRGVDVVRSERGGQATLHAPGQLVSYPIVPIPGRDLSTYVRDLEETLIVLLAGLEVSAHRRARPPRLVRRRKEDRLRRPSLPEMGGQPRHVAQRDVDLSLFDLMVSCGEPDLEQTSLQAVSGRALRHGADQGPLPGRGARGLRLGPLSAADGRRTPRWRRHWVWRR